MPKRPHNRGIRRRNERLPLTNQQLEHLIFGWTWIDDEFPFTSKDERKVCWLKYKDEIFAMMTDDEEVKGFKPYLLVGQRPDAWFTYETVPLRKRWEKIPDYLDRTNLWLPGEREKYVNMKERKEKLYKRLRGMADPDEEDLGDTTY